MGICFSRCGGKKCHFWYFNFYVIYLLRTLPWIQRGWNQLYESINPWCGLLEFVSLSAFLWLFNIREYSFPLRMVQGFLNWTLYSLHCNWISSVDYLLRQKIIYPSFLSFHLILETQFKTWSVIWISYHIWRWIVKLGGDNGWHSLKNSACMPKLKNDFNKCLPHFYLWEKMVGSFSFSTFKFLLLSLLGLVFVNGFS